MASPGGGSGWPWLVLQAVVETVSRPPPGAARTPASVAIRAAHSYCRGVLHVEPVVSRPGLAVLTGAGGRVSHSHGITPTARCRTLPRSATARRSTVSLVPGRGPTERRPA